MMNWYYAEAGKQVGPVTDEQFQELIRRRVITNDTLVWREGMDSWAPFQSLGMAPPPAPAGIAEGVPAPFSTTPGAGPAPAIHTEQEILARDYKVEIGDALTRAWGVFKSNAGTVIGAAVVFLIVLIGCSVASQVISHFFPLILRDVASVILSLLYSAPLIAGLQWFCLRLARKEDASLGDIFGGFSRNYAHVVLFSFTQTVLTLVCALPLILALVLTGMAAIFKPGGQLPADLAGGMILGVGAGGLITLCAVTYMNVLFSFTLLLIVDKGYSFWPALRLSAKTVSRRWWVTFLFIVVVGLVNISGFLACCIGLIVSMPVAMSMLAFVYNDNFETLATPDEEAMPTA